MIYQIVLNQLKWVFRRKYYIDVTLQTFKVKLITKGFRQKECIDYFDKLVKALYDLKQAPKQWHEKFDFAILSNGCSHNNANKCLYSKICDDYTIIVCLYIDDMLILSNDM